MEKQLYLPIGPIENRDASYGAELDRAALPAAAKRLAHGLLERGHTQATDQGERLYAVQDGRVRDLARRLALPVSTLHRGMAALGERGLLCRVRGCLCLIASRLCDLESATSAVVPQAPTDDWGRVSLPDLPPTVRSPACPTAPPDDSQLGQMVSSAICSRFVSVRSSSVSPRSSSVSVCSNSVSPPFHPGQASIPARAQVVVVEDISTYNNQLEPEEVKSLGQEAWLRIHGDTRYPPKPSDHDRLLLLRYAQLALSSELGEAWLMTSAAARPLRGDRQDRVRFFHAAAAYQAWERATGEPPEEPDRRAAKQRLRRALAGVDLPESLVRRTAR